MREVGVRHQTGKMGGENIKKGGRKPPRLRGGGLNGREKWKNGSGQTKKAAHKKKQAPQDQ